ncbi:MAG: sodium:proton antiporter NhaD [Muribaculaceae bacterium]|nr:sodium:proton antiporter NhaD [Muribaculaceae bacterium]
MITTLLVIFILGYLLIACEHVIHINKATFALIMCALLWAIYAMGSHDPDVSSVLIEALGDTCEIVVFLIGAMTIVELIDRYGGFRIIVDRIHANNKRKLMWILSLFAFFLSSVLDNMTTTIIMVMMLRRMLKDQKERWLFSCVIVLAANAGGAWSPIGDITTIMLWMKNYVSSVDLIVNLLIPSLISVVIPVFLATLSIPRIPVEPLNSQDARIGYELYEEHRNLSILILCCGVGGLLFVPVFKTITHLPPYMGILLSLGILWLLTELLVRHYQLDGKIEGRVSQVIKKIDMPTILFFLGILMAVSALSQAGILGELAAWLNETFHDVYIINGIIGILSSIVDNVPLVAACMEMYPVANDAIIAASSDPSYTALFVEDGLFWHLLTFCAGVGGSMLIIGSAAGVVAMGIEKIPFMWYAKRVTWLAFIGYLAGIVTIWIESLILPF